MSEQKSVLKIENVETRYGLFLAVHDVSLEVPQGACCAIIGANGAGKSTLMKTVAGLMKPSRGKVTLFDKDITGMDAHKIVAEGLSMVPEGAKVFPRMTVYENLIVGSYSKHARANRAQHEERVYDLFPRLKERRNQIANSLSGGERQMLAIGRALMSDPKVILFDEISLGLAPVVIKDIYQTIKRINQEGVTVVLVEQDVHRSLKAADIAYVMLEGRVVLSGESKDLPEDVVKKAYFGE